MLLLFVAPFVAETVASANTPAYMFPVVLPVYLVVYGVPAVLLREAWVRGAIGLVSVVLLGVAYTALNEGIVAGTWFSLRPGDGTVLAFTAHQAGHAGGVNWVPAVGLVVFHTVYSLVLPATFVEAWAVPGRGRPWLGKVGLTIGGLLVAVIVLGSLTPKATQRTCAGPAYATCVAGRISAALFLTGLIALALVLPRWRPRQHRSRRTPGTSTLTLCGCAFGSAFLGAFFGLPLTGRPMLAVGALGALAIVAVATTGWWMSSRDWTPRAAVVVGAAALYPGMLTSLAHVRDLQPVAVLIAVGLLWLLYRRVR